MIPYTIIKSNRKTIAIEVKQDGEVVVRAPFFAGDRSIRKIVEGKAEWIEKTRIKVMMRRDEEALTPSFPKFTEDELKSIKARARAQLVPIVWEYAVKMQVERMLKSVSVRAQKTRWGSCSSKGNVNLNCLLVLLPDNVRRYVVIHELSHLLKMNHSKAFWNIVSTFCPTYVDDRNELKRKGGPIIKRLP